MGLFDWFRKSKSVEQDADSIWMTHDAKLQGLIAEVVSSLRDGQFVLIAAHFSATVREVCQSLQHAGIEFEPISEHCSAQQLSRLLDRQTHHPRIILAESMESADPDDRLQMLNENSPTVSVFVAERHPLLSEDTKVVSFAQSLPYRGRLRFFVSLDDALMKRFAGEWVGNLLERMGMKHDECIESQMVARRIEAAQRKIEAQAFGNERTESAEQWFEQNCPNLP